MPPSSVSHVQPDPNWPVADVLNSLLERVEGAERLVDGVAGGAARRATAARRHRHPVQVVVPDLGGLVELLALRPEDDVLQRGVLLVRLEHPVERVDVGLVVLAVVVLERLRRQVRLEGRRVIGQLGQGESHLGSFRSGDGTICPPWHSRSKLVTPTGASVSRTDAGGRRCCANVISLLDGGEREAVRQPPGPVDEAVLAAADVGHVAGEGVPRDAVVLDEHRQLHAVVEQGGHDLADAVVPLARRVVRERDVGGDVRAVGDQRVAGSGRSKYGCSSDEEAVGPRVGRRPTAPGGPRG